MRGTAIERPPRPSRPISGSPAPSLGRRIFPHPSPRASRCHAPTAPPRSLPSWHLITGSQLQVPLLVKQPLDTNQLQGQEVRPVSGVLSVGDYCARGSQPQWSVHRAPRPPSLSELQQQRQLGSVPPLHLRGAALYLFRLVLYPVSLVPCSCLALSSKSLCVLLVVQQECTREYPRNKDTFEPEASI